MIITNDDYRTIAPAHVIDEVENKHSAFLQLIDYMEDLPTPKWLKDSEVYREVRVK
jgi:hypothetical protein